MLLFLFECFLLLSLLLLEQLQRGVVFRYRHALGITMQVLTYDVAS